MAETAGGKATLDGFARGAATALFTVRARGCGIVSAMDLELILMLAMLAGGLAFVWRLARPFKGADLFAGAGTNTKTST